MMKRLILLIAIGLCSAGSLRAADLSLAGEAIQGGLIIARTAPGASATVDGHAIRVSRKGVFLIGFDRDAPETVAVEVTLPDGRSVEQSLSVRRRDYDIQRIDGLPPEQVTPPPEVLARIRDDARQVRAARNRDDDRQDFIMGFQWPVLGPISGVYGSQRVLNGEPRRPHYGVDVAAEEGTPVVSPADGIITLAHPDMYYSGGTLIIDHGHGLSSTFLHLSSVSAEAGQVVRQGQVVGKVGATGRVTGAHLDWRMNLGAARIDPQRLVGPMPTQSE